MLTAPPRREAAVAAANPAAGRPVPPATGAGSAGSISQGGATLALALLTGASAAGLSRVFSGHGWVGPVAAVIVAVHLVCWALRRLRFGSAVAVAAVVVVVVLTAAWTVLGHFTWYGVPTLRTWDHAVSALSDLSSQISSMVAPLATTRTFELVTVAGAGTAAAVADWAAFRWRRPMAALLPGLAIFIFCCTSGLPRGRTVLVGLEVAALCGFLLLERATAVAGEIWFAGQRAGVVPWVITTGGLVAAVAVVAAVALTPALAPRDGTGLVGWRNGIGASGGERVVPNPLVDLRTRLTRYQNTPVFVVSSSIPSYWRLTSLNNFDGTTWTSSGDYASFGGRLPGAAPIGAAVRTARATFQIQQLDSVWLPAQFNPITVQGVRRVTYDQASDSLLAATATSNQLSYAVTSYQYLDTLSAAQLESAPPVSRDAGMAQELQLPSSIGGPITSLAGVLTQGLTSEYAKAVAIQDYLRGPGFTYSLDPPTDGSGDQAIYNFLFQTHTGYCQQFAGAYAVLARAAGLPTRLAVGFVTGTQAEADTYQVYDRDSHTWPEVYFGPEYGWVPFEPTKGFSVPGTGGYAAGGGASQPPVTAVPTTVAPTSGASTSPATRTTPKGAKSAATTLPAVAATHHGAHVSGWWLVVPALLVAWLAFNGAGPLVLRRARRRRAARAGPEAEVLNAWSEVAAELLWHGIRRRPEETDDEFARRAALAVRRLGVDGGWTYGGLEGLGAMARRAAFSASVPAGMGEQAATSAREIERRVATVSPRRRRLARLWSPPPGTWDRLGQLLRPESG